MMHWTERERTYRYGVEPDPDQPADDAGGCAMAVCTVCAVALAAWAVQRPTPIACFVAGALLVAAWGFARGTWKAGR